MPIQIPVTVAVPPVIAPQTGINASLQNGVLTLSFANLGAQVQTAAIAAFPGVPGASWSDFVTQYGGSPGDADGSYQALISPVAPVNGVLWSMLLAYLTAGKPAMTPLNATALLTSIWAQAPNQPL